MKDLEGMIVIWDDGGITHYKDYDEFLKSVWELIKEDLTIVYKGVETKE